MERRLLKPLDDWTPHDVESLVSERVPEGQRLEYKRELDLNPEGQRKEAAKDASGMGNAVGGLIIYGVAEDDADEPVPVEVTPLGDAGVQARLEDILDAAIEPTLNFQTRLVDATDSGYFLLIKVFQRTGPPHMVQAYGDQRHYIRVGVKTRPMTQREVEDAFVAVQASDLRVERMLSDIPLGLRLSVTRKVDALQARMPGKPRPLPLMAVVTAPMDAAGPLLATRRRRGGDFPVVEGPQLGSQHLFDGHYETDGHGYVEERVVDGVLRGRMRLHRNGVCEFAYRSDREDHNAIPSRTFLEAAHDALAYFASVYKRVGYYGRVRVWIGVEDAETSVLIVNSPEHRDGKTNLESVITHADTNVEVLLADPLPLVHNAMDEIWQAYGYDSCWLFDGEGKYTPA